MSASPSPSGDPILVGRVVAIGGGITGCSVAYHLALAGWTDALLIENDPRSVCLDNEPVRVGGEIVGRVTSGDYGFAVERSIAYAYLPPDWAAIGTRGEVEVFGDWIGFEVVREPLYDPHSARIRA